MKKTLSFVLCLMPLAAAAQVNTRVGGPVSGVIFDVKSHSLRPMIGVPGASYLGSAIMQGLDAAAVSPDGAVALASAEGRLLFVSGLPDAISAGTLVESALAGVDRIAWSPDGAYAAVYSSRSAQAQVLRDANRTPAAGALIDVPEAVSSLAIGAAGDLIAGLESGVYLLAPGSSPRLIASAAHATGLAIRGTDLWIADAAANCVRLVRNFAASADAAVFVDGIESPVGVQVSADGKRLLVAAADKSLAAFDTSSRAAAGRIELDFVPSELRAFGARDIWLMNSDSAGADPLYVATGAGEPAAWFVPAGREQ